MLYIFGFGTTRLGEWRLNHIHSINGAEDINASVSDSSAEMEYSKIWNARNARSGKSPSIPIN